MGICQEHIRAGFWVIDMDSKKLIEEDMHIVYS